jgi:hypothetical protein
MSFMQREQGTTSVVMDVESGRPIAIRMGAEDLVVSLIESVRDETFAYPAQSGPRTVFSVRAEGQRFRLVHRHRAREWTVESLDVARAELATAA